MNVIHSYTRYRLAHRTISAQDDKATNVMAFPDKSSIELHLKSEEDTDQATEN